MSIAVELRGVSRHFGDVRAVDSVSLAIDDGEFFSMLGPSGSGKTTCLRLIGGFELPTAGQILLHGVDASDLPPYERDVNTVFQDYALFPHLSVLDNVAYGLRMKGIARAARRREAAAALEQVALAGLGDRHPAQLSGGQRQRVALARALVNRPRVLLLDEPLGALDLKLREQMQVELKGLQRRLGITFIYVTHDQGEALSMSDRVAVFNGGRVEQVDRPRELYVRPRTTFVAGFVGTANVLTGELARRLTGSDRPVSIRPERVTFGAPGPGQLGIAGSVVDVQFHGPTSRFEIEAAGVRLSVTVANRGGDTDGGRPEPGDAVQLAWSAEAMVELRGADPDDRGTPRPDPLARASDSAAMRGYSDATPDAAATPVDAPLSTDTGDTGDTRIHIQPPLEAAAPSATRIDASAMNAVAGSEALDRAPPSLQPLQPDSGPTPILSAPSDAGARAIESAPSGAGARTIQSAPSDSDPTPIQPAPSGSHPTPIQSAPPDSSARPIESAQSDGGARPIESAQSDAGARAIESAQSDAGARPIESAESDEGARAIEFAPSDAGARAIESAPSDAGARAIESAPSDAGARAIESAPSDAGARAIESAQPDSGSTPAQAGQRSARLAKPGVTLADPDATPTARGERPKTPVDEVP